MAKELFTYEEIEKLVDFLPSGSGFDCNYEIEEKVNTFWILSSYHCMNQCGYYDGYQDFKIIIQKDKLKVLDFKLQFINGNYRSRKYFMKDYMEEAIYYSIGEFLNSK